MRRTAFLAAGLTVVLLWPALGTGMGKRVGQGQDAVPSPASSGSTIGQAAESTRTVDKDVPFVPTPRRVVDDMLDMARVGQDDAVYDLGCGDGRIVIAALRDRQARRGVGVDIDPERIKESRRNAAQAGVGDRAEFRQENLFETDLSEATVVTMYLLPSVNLKLRPRLLSQLKPGTRLVSHSFDMKEWKPDQAATRDGSSIYYWTVPANVSGDWSWTAPDGQAARLRLRQRFQEVTGVLALGDRRLDIREAALDGSRLRFAVDQGQPGKSRLVRYEGRVGQDGLQGAAVAQDGAMDLAQWRAWRDPTTIASIDGEETAPIHSGSIAPGASPP